MMPGGHVGWGRGVVSVARYGQQVGMLPAPEPEISEALVAAGEMFVRQANRQRRLPTAAA